MSPEMKLIVEPTSFSERKATSSVTCWQVADDPPGSKSGACRRWVLQEPGRPCMFHGAIKRTGTACKALAPRRRCAGCGANPQRSRGTPKRRQRSAGGRHARSRSPLIVPTKAGKCPQATRWRKGTGRLDVLFEDQDVPDIELGDHLNATRKASELARRH